MKLLENKLLVTWDIKMRHQSDGLYSISIFPAATAILALMRNKMSMPNKPSTGPPNGRVWAITENRENFFPKVLKLRTRIFGAII